MKYDYLIVGAGIFGCTLAERIANDLKAAVLIIDKRSHIGGNCYSELDKETGIETHKYGTHVFHTSSGKAWEYITKFTEFNSYHHQVFANYRNKLYRMPFNLETINSFYGVKLTPSEAKKFMGKEIGREDIGNPKNLEEKAISLVGRPLYEAFIKHYTIKQWAKNPKDLPSNIIERLPVRYDYRNDYFANTRWQGIPIDGYTAMFEKMLKSPRIRIKLNCDYFKHSFKVNKKVIYTGPIDQYFGYKYGKLEWRTAKLSKKIINLEDYQGTSVINYADPEVKYTRIHEPKHLHPERKQNKNKTVIFYETSTYDKDNPHYPINSESNQEKLKKYKKLAFDKENIIIGGRLGDYAYYDIDKAILNALDTYNNRIKLNT